MPFQPSSFRRKDGVEKKSPRVIATGGYTGEVWYQEDRAETAVSKSERYQVRSSPTRIRVLAFNIIKYIIPFFFLRKGLSRLSRRSLV